MIAAFGKSLYEQRHSRKVTHHQRAADALIELLHQVQNFTGMRLINFVVIGHLGSPRAAAHGTVPRLPGAYRARTQHPINRHIELCEHPAGGRRIAQPTVVQRAVVVGGTGVPRRFCVPHHHERVLAGTRRIQIVHGSRVCRAADKVRDNGDMAAASWTTITPTTLTAAGFAPKLVAIDMDGTLLREDHTIPDEFWPLARELQQRGIEVVPASGRQYATLLEQFAQLNWPLTVIADNGNMVAHHGELVAATRLPDAVTTRVIDTSREAAAGHELGVVLCGHRTAYVERDDAAFIEQVRRYYIDYEVVDDLHEVDDEVLKIAVYSFESAVAVAPLFDAHTDRLRVVVSSLHWIDLMDPHVNKGTALRELQRALGVTAAETIAFGDYLNDLELVRGAEWSFAMANAHPQVQQAANFIAPSNEDAGVVQVLRHLLAATAS